MIQEVFKGRIDNDAAAGFVGLLSLFSEMNDGLHPFSYLLAGSGAASAGGTMGFAMARNLARAGIEVRAWNRTRQQTEAKRIEIAAANLFEPCWALRDSVRRCSAIRIVSRPPAGAPCCSRGRAGEPPLYG